MYFVEIEVTSNPAFSSETLDVPCASLQYTFVDYLMDKLKNAVELTGIKEVAIGGGVSANSGIRTALIEAEKKYSWKTHIPKIEYCTDNAAMIAMVGELKYKQGLFAKYDVVAKARMKM